MMTEKPFRTGILCVLRNIEGTVLLGKRKNAFASGEYGLPGGHVEEGESISSALIRELAEELGIRVSMDFATLIGVTEYRIDDWEADYLTFEFLISKWDGTISLQEKEKCEGWEWHSVHHVPAPLHEPARITLDHYHTWRKEYKHFFNK